MGQNDVRDFFISYNKADRAWAEWIAWQLEEEGYATILQAWDFRPGSNFVLLMQDAATKAKRTIAVLSPDYLDAHFTQPEWAAAFVQDPEGKDHKLLPIRIKECRPAGLLRAISYIDLVGLNESAAHSKLLTGILNTRAKPSQPPLFPGMLPQEKPQAPSFPGSWPELRLVPYNRNLFFTGRNDLLERLFQQLKAPSIISHTYALSGLGGIGKTQMALEYLYRYEQNYRCIFWITAATEETLIADFEKVAIALNIPERDPQKQSQTIEAVKQWFSQHQDWLMVFDNVDDLHVVAPYLPSHYTPNTHILLTTQLQMLGSIGHILPIEKLGMEEAILLLLRRARILTPDEQLDQLDTQQRGDAEAIVTELGGLPLAIDQAGAYIEENGVSLTEYRQLYRQYHSQLLERRGQFAPEHPDTVASTWSIALNKIEQINPAARDVLRLSAFLAPDMIPIDLFTKGASYLGNRLSPIGKNALKLNETIEILRRYSFLQRNPKARSINVHRLVQTVIKDEMNAQTQRTWVERAIKAVNKLFPYAEYSTWSLCEQYLAHAEACKEHIEQYNLTFSEAGYLLHKIGLYWQDHAAYQQALPLYQRALAIKEKAEGPEHPSTATTLHELARLYHNMGNYNQALPLYQRALAISEKAKGSEHPSTAATMNELAGLYQDMGNYQQALPLYQRALAIKEKAKGSEHPSTATTLHELGRLYQNMGNYQQALPLYQRALAIHEKAEGPEHPHTGETLHELARLYQNMGNYQQALPLYQRALAIHEKAEGPEHPSTAATLNELAGLYQDMSNYDQALPLFQRALAIKERALIPEHPDTATTLHELARLYQNMGNYQQALPLYQRALAIYEKTLGPEHPYTATTLHELARLYQNMGNYDQALPLLQRALAIEEKALGPEHPSTAITVRSLAVLYRQMGNYEQADALTRRYSDGNSEK